MVQKVRNRFAWTALIEESGLWITLGLEETVKHEMTSLEVSINKKLLVIFYVGGLDLFLDGVLLDGDFF